MAWGNVPMLPHVMRQGSDDHPNKELQARCAAMDGEGALAASLFTGFPHADISNAGLSAVVVTDGDKALAEKLRDELLDRAWADREDFRLQASSRSKQSLARAKAMRAAAARRGADRAARPLRQLRLGRHDGHDRRARRDPARGLENVAAFAIYDPEAVQQAIAAGIGAEVTLSIGGKMAMPQIPGESRAADRDRDGQDDLERPLPQQGADGARRADGHGAERRASTPARPRSR